MSPLAAIHVGKKQLGLDEGTYRDLLERVTGQRTARGLDATQLDAVVAELRRLGFEPASTRARKGLEGPYAKKLQALWIAAHNLGIVQHRDDKALTAFVERQTGIPAVRWLRDAADARKAVEALKAWLAREGGAWWGPNQGADFFQHNGGRIAWAQWVKLNPGATLYPDRMGFDEAVWRIVGGAPGRRLGSLTPADWRAVMNALGATLRAARRQPRRAAIARSESRE